MKKNERYSAGVTEKRSYDMSPRGDCSRGTPASPLGAATLPLLGHVPDRLAPDISDRPGSRCVRTAAGVRTAPHFADEGRHYIGVG